MRKSSACNFECNKTCGISDYLKINICTCKELIFDKLVLPYEDRLMKKSETVSTNVFDKK